MANALFDLGRDGFLDQSATGYDWDTDAHRVALVDDTDVTFNIATNNDWADLVAGLVHANAESGNMSSKATDGAGVADADDITLTTVTGDAADYVICFHESGVDATSAEGAELVWALLNATGPPPTAATS